MTGLNMESPTLAFFEKGLLNFSFGIHCRDVSALGFVLLPNKKESAMAFRFSLTFCRV